MGERGFGIRSGSNKQKWEEADAPIVCESCLGENPYVRMMKAPAHKECKICARPFTNFRWKAGPKGRFKNTEVCQTCAKLKNVCQTCILDLTYHLPVQVRDKFLGDQQVALPTQEANKNFYIDQANRNMDDLALPYDSLSGNKVLEELARNRAKPYYARNLPQICSFFVKGDCRRGDECPYRHELPNQENPELANQNILDRFHGKNDPVANKIMNKAYDDSKVKPPADQSIATLFLNDLPSGLTQEDLIDIFKTYGDVDEVRIFPNGRMATLSFLQRSACEKAVSELYGNLVMKGQSVQVRWNRPDKTFNKPKEVIHDNSMLVPQNIPSMIKGPIQTNPNIRPPTMPPPDMNMGNMNRNKFIDNIAQVGNSVYYPSMDPNALGGMRPNQPGYYKR